MSYSYGARRRRGIVHARCPYCSITFVALDYNQLADLSFGHVDADHPEIVASWRSA